MMLCYNITGSDSRLSQQHCVYSALWQAQVLAGGQFSSFGLRGVVIMSTSGSGLFLMGISVLSPGLSQSVRITQP